MCGICGEIRFGGRDPDLSVTAARHLGVLEMWLQEHGIGA